MFHTVLVVRTLVVWPFQKLSIDCWAGRYISEEDVETRTVEMEDL